MHLSKPLTLTIMSIFSNMPFALNGQNSNIDNSQKNLYPAIEKIQSDIDKSKRLKISGFIQAQYQYADTAGISSIAGGPFEKDCNNRFSVRRGFVKLDYTNDLAKAVLQANITEKGFAMEDAYIELTDPWMKSSGFTAGLFNRPFGYEITYPSSMRESPERARIFQTLFPGERDVGAKVSIRLPEKSGLNFISLDLGLFNGNGINIETDKYKDFIGHLSVARPGTGSILKWNLGASLYEGGFATVTDKAYRMMSLNGVEAFSGSTVKIGERAKREYYGIEGQLIYNGEAGQSKIMAEYLTGEQPSGSSNTSSLTKAAAGDVYFRDFRGYYVYFIQNILKTPFQIVVKYDVYDPNTSVSGSEIGRQSVGGVSTGPADIEYSTLGLGFNYYITSNVKFLAYYDFIRNETTPLLSGENTLTDYTKDKKDNILTLRLQYKF